MINPSEYHGNFAADHADHYDSMIGSMNYSAAADDVHVSAVSTATLGGSDDVGTQTGGPFAIAPRHGCGTGLQAGV